MGESQSHRPLGSGLTTLELRLPTLSLTPPNLSRRREHRSEGQPASRALVRPPLPGPQLAAPIVAPLVAPPQARAETPAPSWHAAPDAHFHPRPVAVTANIAPSASGAPRGAGFQITQLHLIAGMVMIIFVWLVANGPHAAMSTNPLNVAPKLPAVPGSMPSGSTSASTLGFHTEAQGMPSPAAAQQIGAERGIAPRQATMTGLHLKGIPSPAAAAALVPQTLPFTPAPDVSLPLDSGARDAHGVDSHYGIGSGGGAAPRRIGEPLTTPGASSSDSERRARDIESSGAITGADDAYAGYVPI